MCPLYPALPKPGCRGTQFCCLQNERMRSLSGDEISDPIGKAHQSPYGSGVMPHATTRGKKIVSLCASSSWLVVCRAWLSLQSSHPPFDLRPTTATEQGCPTPVRTCHIYATASSSDHELGETCLAQTEEWQICLQRIWFCISHHCLLKQQQQHVPLIPARTTQPKPPHRPSRLSPSPLQHQHKKQEAK